MEKVPMDPSNVTIASERLPIPKMRTSPASLGAPRHRKAKLLTRCPLREGLRVLVANLLALLLMAGDVMR